MLDRSTIRINEQRIAFPSQYCHRDFNIKYVDQLVAFIAVVQFILGLALPQSAFAEVPEFSVEDGAVKLKGVGPDNPIIYDNDWWFDVFDNNYLWAHASLGNAKLKGNIVSRDMWEWRNGYQYKFEQCVKDADKALRLARAAGLKNIPDLTHGAQQVLQRPNSGRIDDTKLAPTAGSRLIVEEAKKATARKPLLVISGGPLTTVANALLTNPEIANRIVVFNLTVSSNGYNGKDSWSPYIVAKRTRLVDWATGSFWDKNSVFREQHFASLPDNPFCNDMRRLIKSDLGKANQLGDGAALVWLWNNRCWHRAETRRAVWKGDVVRFEPTDENTDADVLTIPKSATDLALSRDEFFRVMSHDTLFNRAP